VTAGHLAPTLGEPDPAQSRGDTWIRNLSRSYPVLPKRPRTLTRVKCTTSAYSPPPRWVFTCGSLGTHHCTHRNDCSLGSLLLSERGPHLRARIRVSPATASDEFNTGSPTLGPPGVSHIYAQRPTLRWLQKFRRPSGSLAPWAVRGRSVVGWFPGLLGGGERVRRLGEGLEGCKRARRECRIDAFDGGK